MWPTKVVKEDGLFSMIIGCSFLDLEFSSQDHAWSFTTTWNSSSRTSGTSDFHGHCHSYAHDHKCTCAFMPPPHTHTKQLNWKPRWLRKEAGIGKKYSLMLTELFLASYCKSYNQMHPAATHRGIVWKENSSFQMTDFICFLNK